MLQERVNMRCNTAPDIIMCVDFDFKFECLKFKKKKRKN